MFRALLFLLTALILLTFAVPALACDVCNKAGPDTGISAAFDVDHQSTDVANQNTYDLPSPNATNGKGSSLAPAVTLINFRIEPAPRARDVADLTLILAHSSNIIGYRPKGDGRLLLRQGGRPTA